MPERITCPALHRGFRPAIRALRSTYPGALTTATRGSATHGHLLSSRLRSGLRSRVLGQVGTISSLTKDEIVTSVSEESVG
jgi:hypothetical protein